MKFLTVCIFILTISACTNKKKNPVPELPSGNYCYEYNLSFDTIRVNIAVNEADISGSMRYIFFEKDNSTGKLTGKIEGDKIIADYNASGSGGEFATEIIFLIRDGELNVGFGEMTEKDGMLIYKDTSRLNFDTFALRPSDCE